MLTDSKVARIGLLMSTMSLVKERSKRFRAKKFHIFTKISEWKTFLLQVCDMIFCCEMIMPLQDFYCVLYFIRGIGLITSFVVTEEQIILSQLFLFTFTERFRKLNCIALFTWSLHAVCHMPFWVRVWGPVIGTQSLVAERDNAKFNRCITSGRNPVLEVAQQVSKKLQSGPRTWVYDDASLDTVFTPDQISQLSTILKNCRRPDALSTFSDVQPSDDLDASSDICGDDDDKRTYLVNINMRASSIHISRYITGDS